MRLLILAVLIPLVVACGTAPYKGEVTEKRIPAHLLKTPAEPILLPEKDGNDKELVYTDTELLENLVQNAELWKLLREQVLAIIEWDRKSYSQDK